MCMRARRILSIVFLSAASIVTTVAAAAATAQADVVHACALLSKGEVKKIVPWQDFLDQIPLEEDPIPGGSGCGYPSVYVQVMAMDQARWKRFVNDMKNPPMEAIPGVGDEAYLRDNKGNFAEFVAKVGGQVLTIQRSLNPMTGMTMDNAKPGVIELGKAFVAKLR